MAGDQGNNSNGSEDKEFSEMSEMESQFKMLTEQLLIFQQTQTAVQRTQEAMLETLRTLQQNPPQILPLTSTDLPSIPENSLNSNITPQNSERQGVPRILLSQVNPTTLNFTSSQTPPVYPAHASSSARSGIPTNPMLSQTSPNFIHALPTQVSPNPQPLLALEQLKCHVHELVQQENMVIPAGSELDLRPPYPAAISKLPYPEGYIVPKFVKFDGKKGNAREHVVRFIDLLGVHAEDKNLRLREFSKSLTHKAYTWHANLPVESINSWEDLVKKFYAKFFYVEERCETQKYGENLLSYVLRFREKAIDVYKIPYQKSKW